MVTIRVTGYVDQNGQIQLDEPFGKTKLPPGKVILTLKAEGKEAREAADAADDAHWEKSFADPRSKGLLAKMAAKARANRDAGLNQELDPDTL